MLLRLKLGRGLEDKQRLAWDGEFGEPIVTSPAAMGVMLFHVSVRVYTRKPEGACIHCFDNDSPIDWLWRFPILPGGSGRFSMDRARVYVWHEAGTLVCFPRDGGRSGPLRTRVRTGFPDWSAKVGVGSMSPAPGEGILTVATNAELLALDDSTGTVLWRVPLKETPLFGPVRLPKGIVLATPKGIAVHKIVDGSVAWTVDCGPLAAPLNADADRIAAITKSGELLVLAASDGKQLAKVSLHRQDACATPPLLLGDKVLFVNKDLTLLRDLNEPPVQWARTSWLGTVTTPLVLLDGCVYFATDAKGVVCVGAPKR